MNRSRYSSRFRQSTLDDTLQRASQICAMCSSVLLNDLLDSVQPDQDSAIILIRLVHLEPVLNKDLLLMLFKM